MFRIKICGVTSLADARAALEAGADVIGLNFYQKSPRYVSVDQAKLITSEISRAVGVFVNSSAAEINRIARDVGLEAVQLHGDEPPGLLAELDTKLPIIRARSLDERGISGIAHDLGNCRAAGRTPSALLVDAAVQGQYGGTGQMTNWEELVNHSQLLGGVPLALAGGLKAENVAGAILTVRPHAVDVASGVESSPGVKNFAQMQAFVRNAQQAFSIMGS